MPPVAKKQNNTSEPVKNSEASKVENKAKTVEPAVASVKVKVEPKSKVEVASAPVSAAPAVSVAPAVSAAPAAPAAPAAVDVPVKKPRGKAAPVVVAKVDESGSPASSEEVVSDDKTVDQENVVQLLADKIVSLALLVKDIQSSIKPVLKEHDKLRKIVERIQKKRDNARKSPSGFAKPNKISDELCDFIGVPHGTEKSRTDITRYINAYVKEHNLNKPTNRRIILPDDKLKNILKINNDEEVTFFILQRLISHHFPAAGSKSVSAATSAPAPAAAAETVVSA
jgi:chromatin remodeling complex protein RSC6